MSNTKKVVLKPLATVIAEILKHEHSSIHLNDDGKVVELFDARQEITINNHMLKFFDGTTEYEIDREDYASDSSRFDGPDAWTYINEWVQEFIEEPQVQEGEFKGRYKGELMEVRVSCCGCPLIYVTDTESGKTESFHVDSEEDAKRLCDEIMGIYNR